MVTAAGIPFRHISRGLTRLLFLSHFRSGSPVALLWHYKNKLISKSAPKDVLSQHLDDFFASNDTPDVDIFTLWNAYKVCVRGILKQLGAWAKWLKSANLQLVISELRDLDRQNKTNPDPSKLTKLCLKLRSMLEDSHNLMLRQLKSQYY